MRSCYLRILFLFFFAGVVTQSWALAPKSVFAPKRNILEILGVSYDPSLESYPISSEQVRSLLVLYGINPEWADQGASFVLINRTIDRGRTSQQDNDKALQNTAITARKNEQPKGIYLVDFDPTQPEDRSDVFKFFHEFFHHLFFYRCFRFGRARTIQKIDPNEKVGPRSFWVL